jgi:hypothetical protein
MNKRGAVLAALMLACGACRCAPRKASVSTAQTGSPEASAMEWHGTFCGETAGSQRIIQSAPEWRALWTRSIGKPAPPAPDFKSQFAIAVFLGQRNSGGYSVAWLAPEISGQVTVVPFREVLPRGMTIMALTQPYAVKVFSRTTPDIKVEARPA